MKAWLAALREYDPTVPTRNAGGTPPPAGGGRRGLMPSVLDRAFKGEL
ncbi:MAG TPA: hypothetical protein VJ821_12865 [Anaerolineales bacterium]|nr:hypothetical protein [Anaerolineales bacterium]